MSEIPIMTEEKAALSALLDALREKLGDWNAKHGSAFEGISDGQAVGIRSELMPACRTFADRIEMLAALPKGKVFAEIGIYSGDFSAKILELNQPREFHSYNWDFKYVKPENIDILKSYEGVFFHEGDPDFVFTVHPPSTFDIIYLNKSKNYAAIRRELAYCLERLNPDGILVVHDFTAWDPVQGIPYGVMPAVCQFVNEQSLEVVYMSLHPRGFCDIALRRTSNSALLRLGGDLPEVGRALLGSNQAPDMQGREPDGENLMTWPWITTSGNVESSRFAMACRTSLDAAMENQGPMNAGIYSVGGFCGRKFRLFLNNLIRAIDDPRYLEIGVFSGATLCAAIEGNTLKAVGVDDWSWGGLRKTMRSSRTSTGPLRFTSREPAP